MKHTKLTCICAVAILAMAHGVTAQSGNGPVPAPAQIAAAHKVFVSNGGGEIFETGVDQRALNGGPDRPYNEFYTDMKTWGRFELLSAPADADLVLRINFELTEAGMEHKTVGRLRLLVIDPKTDVRLWTITEFVRGAVLLGNRDKNFDQAMSTMIDRLKALSNPPAFR